MNDKPLVSIIMAAKDTAPYLRQCLDSILDQTYSNWELIAVNDHSSDETPEILNEYASRDKRIRVFNSNGHKLIPALQVGYAMSKGALINRMDSDDKMPIDKLEVLVKEWMKYGKGHVIAGGTKHFKDTGEVGEGFIKYENWLNKVAQENSHYKQIYKECVIPSHCWIIHREDFDKADAFNPIVYPEDYDLCFRFYEQALKIIGIDKVLHYWRDRSNRISRTWEEYKDNRYYDLKLHYLYKLDRQPSRPLVVWGAGKNGKDLVRKLQHFEDNIHWVCDNENKIGKDIYGIIMQHYDNIPVLNKPQILVCVTKRDAIKKIKDQLKAWGKFPVDDYWLFI